MNQAEVYRRKIESARKLHSVVHSMKGITMTGIRQFEDAAASLAEYYRTVEQGMQVVLRDMPHALPEWDRAPEDGVGLIVFGSSQALCGSFDQVMADYLHAYLKQRGPSGPRMIVLGERLYHFLKDSVEGPHQPVPAGLPGTVEGITDTVAGLLVTIEQWRQVQGIGTVRLFYNKLDGETSYGPQRWTLLPLGEEWIAQGAREPWPTNNLPQYRLSQARLLASLVRQYLFVSLYRAVADSLAAEYTSRLSSMQVAAQKIDDWLLDLQKQQRQQRQSSITEELLDIMTGFELVRDPER